MILCICFPVAVLFLKVCTNWGDAYELASLPYALEVNNDLVEFLIDSGASCNIVTMNSFEKMKHMVNLEKCFKRVYPYDNNVPLQVRGAFRGGN